VSNSSAGFSVLMSVYDKENPSHLCSSLESVASQTLKPDEFILVEDGPINDNLIEVINSFRGQMSIVSVRLPFNQGLAAALNEGLKYCKHELIVRMDSDDVCFPDRFEKQLCFMRDNPDIDFSSGFIEEYDDKMLNRVNIRTLPLEHSALKDFAKMRSPMSHAATIYKKSAVLNVGGYPNFYPEDYALWTLMIAKGYKMANLPHYLLKVRAGDAMISRRGLKFLKGYIKTYRLMYNLGLINFGEFVMNVLKQTILRISPTFVRKLMYKYARS